MGFYLRSRFWCWDLLGKGIWYILVISWLDLGWSTRFTSCNEPLYIVSVAAISQGSRSFLLPSRGPAIAGEKTAPEWLASPEIWSWCWDRLAKVMTLTSQRQKQRCEDTSRFLFVCSENEAIPCFKYHPNYSAACKLNSCLYMVIIDIMDVLIAMNWFTGFGYVCLFLGGQARVPFLTALCFCKV